VSRRLEVLLHNIPVGVLAETPDRGAEFKFLDTYRDLALRPVLGQKGTLERLRASWREIVAELPLPEAHHEALVEHWRKVPLLREAGPLE
jgi:hypothetical protein